MKKNSLWKCNIWCTLFIISILIYILIWFFIWENSLCFAIIEKNNNTSCIVKLWFLSYIIKYSWFWVISLFLFNQWRQENIINIIKNADEIKIRIKEILNNHLLKEFVDISVIEKLLDEEENTEFEIETYLWKDKLTEYIKSTQGWKTVIINELRKKKEERKDEYKEKTEKTFEEWPKTFTNY